MRHLKTINFGLDNGVHFTPNLGRTTRMSLVAADYLLMPIECQEWAVKGASQMIKFVQKVKSRANPKLTLLGLVINKYNKRRSMELQYNKMLRELNLNIFSTEIKNNVQYAETASAKTPINYLYPNTPQSNTYYELTKEIIKYV